jgi:hypothetical protein
MRTPVEAVRLDADRPCPTSGRSPVPDAKALPVWGRPLASGGAVSPASAVACGRRAAHRVTSSCPVYKRKGAFAFTSHVMCVPYIQVRGEHACRLTCEQLA